MDLFKIVNFNKAHSNESFPIYSEVPDPELLKIRSRIASALGLEPCVDGLAIVNQIASRSKPVDNTDAIQDTFDLSSLIADLSLVAEGQVLLNWNRFDRLDSMQLSALSKYLKDIWYPSSDDLEIICGELSWILTVHHHGGVSFLYLD